MKRFKVINQETKRMRAQFSQFTYVDGTRHATKKSGNYGSKELTVGLRTRRQIQSIDQITI